MISIYQNKNRLKWIIIGLALLVGVVSLVYSHQLVKQLSGREQSQMDLFAKAQKLLTTTTDPDTQDFLLNELIRSNTLIPVILTDERLNPLDYRNLSVPEDLSEQELQEWLGKKVQEMRSAYPPVVVEGADWKNYIFYDNSLLIRSLRYFPYVQLSVLAILAVLAYFTFNTTRMAEQNRVWVGLAKETAHQLGTPISSLMAWLDYLKLQPHAEQEFINEMEKDIRRLEMITARFSSIGSVPTLRSEELQTAIEHAIGYLRPRISSRVNFELLLAPKPIYTPLNLPLFEWVLENICKNAVDAMTGKGDIRIRLQKAPEGKWALLDITDTGKGMTRAQFSSVFQPGYTTRKRGWGLGLTLAKRIVENYHKGKIYVLWSEPGKGTTFRLMLPLSLDQHT